MTPEIKQVLMHAHDEIVALRRRIDEIAPKAEAYDLLHAAITRLRPAPTQGFGVDVAWRIKELLGADAPEAEASAGVEQG